MTVELDQKLVDGLPFEPKQQDALLGFALTDRNFLLQIKDRIKANWFVDGWTGKAFDIYVKFYDKFGHEPKSDDELFLFEEVFILPPIEKNKLKAAILRARNETTNYSLDVLVAGLTGWLQSRIYHQHVSHSATLFNNRKFTEAKGVLGEAVRQLQDLTFEGKPPADFSNPRGLVSRITDTASNALTFGHPLFDKLLGPDCKKGSLLPGDTTILLSPTNIGKTTTKITTAVANIMQGKSVIMVFHEGRKDDIMEKVWCSLLKCTKADFRLLALSDNPAIVAQLTAFAKIIEQNLVLIDHQKPGSTVEEVISMARMHQHRRKARLGKGFDMFVDDYPAILGAEGLANIRTERRHKDAYVYRYFVDFCGEQDMHGLFSIQTNREGSKKNKRSGEFHNKSFLVSLEDVQEAYEVTNSATNLITVNRSPQDQAREIITFLICKSRSSETNIAVTCRSNFKCARSHDPELPATWFRGTEALDQLDSLISTYANQEVPYNYKDQLNETSRS